MPAAVSPSYRTISAISPAKPPQSMDRVKDTVRGIIDQVASVQRDLEQINALSEGEVQKNRAISEALGRMDGEVAALSSGKFGHFRGADEILAAVTEVVQGGPADRRGGRTIEYCFATGGERVGGTGAGCRGPGRRDRGDRLAGRRARDSRMPDVVAEPLGGAQQRFLTFLIGERHYALPATQVAEVIRLPPVARLPRGPKALMGSTNLRGTVVPVVSLPAMLGRPAADATNAARAIIMSGVDTAALVVDAVDGSGIVPRRAGSRRGKPN